MLVPNIDNKKALIFILKRLFMEEYNKSDLTIGEAKDEDFYTWLMINKIIDLKEFELLTKYNARQKQINKQAEGRFNRKGQRNEIINYISLDPPPHIKEHLAIKEEISKELKDNNLGISLKIK